MEALGFIDAPMVTTTRPAGHLPPPLPAPPNGPSTRDPEGVTIADQDPNAITAELLGRRVRWSMVLVVVAVAAAVSLGGAWLWQRPAAVASAALSDVADRAGELAPELRELRALNAGLLDADLDGSAVSTQTRAVESRARALFNVSGAIPDSAAASRSLAAEVATTSLDASRLLGGAVAYRSAVLPLLVPPDLETDPDLIGLDEAIRSFGEWQARFNDVRSVLPAGILSAVSAELELVSARLDSIRDRYVAGLRDDDAAAAEAALEELAAGLGGVESVLETSLTEVQARVDGLIVEGLAGIGDLSG